jgi:hypothetical protein
MKGRERTGKETEKKGKREGKGIEKRAKRGGKRGN